MQPADIDPLLLQLNSERMTELTNDSFAYCTRLAKSHYENFHVAAWFLPKALRLPFYVVYAYCRCSDDIADEHHGSPESSRLALNNLDDWEKILNVCFTFQQSELKQIITQYQEHRELAQRSLVFPALQQIAQQYHLPRQPFADLLKAFRQDQTKKNYQTYDELLDYCKYSANPVGAVVLHLVSEPTQEQLAWSDSICTGLQLANFWQDVLRDKKIGRCYIPQDIAKRYDVNLENLQDSASLRSLLRELVEDARRYLKNGEPLVDAVPKNVRRDIRLFIDGGLAILDAIEKKHYGVLLQRPVVSKWKKIRLLLRAMW
jgi:squalene synthase HpnC